MKSDGFAEDKDNRVIQTEIVKCASCGSNMLFNPEEQSLYCEHCGSVRNIESKGVASEIDLLKGFSEEDEYDLEDVVYECENCGAKVVLNKSETANFCPFCGTPHVTKTDELAGLKPNGVIPFKFGKKKAVEYSKLWAKKRIFAPRKFKKSLKTENLNGVYVPCFTFDSYTTSSYSGKIGITHVERVGSGKNARTRTWTEWRHIAGKFYDNFDDILISAGEKFDQRKVDKLSPFDTNNGKRYLENYILGFMAYRYDYEIADCWGKAKTVIDEKLKRRILSQYVYDKVAYLNVSTSHERVTYKYEMLPVYVGSFNYSKKLYNFYVNGENGKVWGTTPKSVLKILLCVLLGLGIVFLVAILFMNGCFSETYV